MAESDWILRVAEVGNAARKVGSNEVTLIGYLDREAENRSVACLVLVCRELDSSI